MRKEKFIASVSSLEMPMKLLRFFKESFFYDGTAPDHDMNDSYTDASYNERYRVPVAQMPLIGSGESNKMSITSRGESPGSMYAVTVGGEVLNSWKYDARSNQENFCCAKAKSILFSRLLLHGGFEDKSALYRGRPSYQISIPDEIKASERNIGSVSTWHRNAGTSIQPRWEYHRTIYITTLKRIPELTKTYHLEYGPYTMAIESAVVAQLMVHEIYDEQNYNSLIHIFRSSANELANAFGYVTVTLFDNRTNAVLNAFEPMCFNSNGRIFNYSSRHGCEILQMIELTSHIAPGRYNSTTEKGMNPYLVWHTTNEVIELHSWLIFKRKAWHDSFKIGNYWQHRSGLAAFVVYHDPVGENWRTESFVRRFPSRDWTGTADYNRYDFGGAMFIDQMGSEAYHTNLPKILIVPVIWKGSHLYPEMYHVMSRIDSTVTKRNMDVVCADDRYYVYIHPYIIVRLDEDFDPSVYYTIDSDVDADWIFIGESSNMSIQGLSDNWVYIKVAVEFGEYLYTIIFASTDPEFVFSVDGYTFTFDIFEGTVSIVSIKDEDNVDHSDELIKWTLWEMAQYSDVSESISESDIYDDARTLLKAKIDEAETYDQSEYSSSSWSVLMTALTDAKAVYNDPNTTSDEVTESYITLMDAIEQLSADDSALLSTLAEAREALAKDGVSLRYTASSKAVLEESVAYYDNTFSKQSNHTQSEIDQMTLRLRQAIDGLALLNKQDLIEAITQCENSNIDPDDYTATSYEAYNSKLDNAKAVRDDPLATEEEISTAKEELLAAFTGLKRIAGIFNNTGALIKSWDQLITDGDIILDANGVLTTPSDRQTRFANARKLIIDSDVISLGTSAFMNCSGLNTIIIPNGLTAIGTAAFFNCVSLTSIDIADSVTTIGNLGFYGCSNLPEITIPDSVTSIGARTFNLCNKLTTIRYSGTATGAPWGAPNATVVPS